MPQIINGEKYFRTHEVCQLAGISKSTLFRWLEENVLEGSTERDWRGWRLFTLPQVEKIKGRTTEYRNEILK